LLKKQEEKIVIERERFAVNKKEDDFMVLIADTLNMVQKRKSAI
jgi:hypothetical protein